MYTNINTQNNEYIEIYYNLIYLLGNLNTIYIGNYFLNKKQINKL